MKTDEVQSHDAAAVRDAFRFDEDRLEDYLSAHVKEFAGPLTVEQFTKGQSNPTYLLRTPGKQYVLRRKPPSQVLASAHAVDREYRVMTALGEHTSVPVPRTYVLCTDESVIGTWFFVMERVQGRIFWSCQRPRQRVCRRRREAGRVGPGPHPMKAFDAREPAAKSKDFWRRGV